MAFNTIYAFEVGGTHYDAIQSYVDQQKTAGTTDGNKIQTNIDGFPAIQRTWNTSDAANAFISYINSLTPAPVHAKVVSA